VSSEAEWDTIRRIATIVTSHCFYRSSNRRAGDRKVFGERSCRELARTEA